MQYVLIIYLVFKENLNISQTWLVNIVRKDSKTTANLIFQILDEKLTSFSLSFAFGALSGLSILLTFTLLTVLVVVGRTQDYVDVEDSLLEGGDEKRAALEKRIYPNYLKSTFSSNKFPIFDILCVKCKMFKQERFISLHQWVKLRMKKTTQIFSKNLMKFKYDMCVPL